MDAGVPIAAPVGGIAMGLVAEDGKYTTLTDILGAEDAFGDMDFKVAGTSEFVTALQLDTKLTGIPADVLAGALTQAQEARTEILKVITDAIPEPRKELNTHAPRVIVEYIPADKIGEVIGPKGKIIREITDETGADIDIDDADGRGVVKIYSADSIAAESALARIRAIANPVVPREGERYYGTVVKTVDFGAFVSLTPGNDGLLHISKLGGDKRLNHADEAVQVGDKLWVEVTQVKDGRKFSLEIVEGPGSEEAAEAPVEEPVEAPVEDSAADASEPAADEPDTTVAGEGRRERTAPVERSRTRVRSSQAEDPDDDDEEGGTRRRRRRRRP
jgi:polyribonucleotide nucleotidyltransferase